MTKIYGDDDGDVSRLDGQDIAIVGYGNQGRCWALNLRDSGCRVRVCVRADETRAQAQADGFTPADLDAASTAPIACLLIPDGAIPELPIERPADGLTVVASGYTVAFGRYEPPGDVGLVAPRMLGPEVRRCFTDGTGFVTAVGVHRDVTGTALARTLAVAKAIGGLRQGAIELTPMQEAVLDLAVEQILSPALTHVTGAFVRTMIEREIPIEAVLAELYLSGEVERNYRLLREFGFVGQLELHSPTSQYGQLSRRGRFDHLDVAARMRELADEIESGRFADEWDAESRAGYPRLAKLKAEHAGASVAAFEDAVRSRLGPKRPNGRGD
ncbi:ketol-acid reductoisomerase [Myxococcota bacterium]|nr:ketol-acid reductoisomerase [Myxococcota bacterium]MCZ7617370.1 ketol-acid reductoisomerase [Myxococcota bacterium]